MIYLRNSLVMLLALAVLASCTGEKWDSETVVKEFYKEAKEREKDLDILFNVAFTARGRNDDGTFEIHHVRYEFSDSKRIALPVIETGRSKHDVIASGDYQNVKEYASMQGITEAQALDYITEVPILVNQLKVGKVFSSARQGRFIVFSLSDEDDVIYVPDTSKVYSESWKKFFRTGKQLGDKWYYKRTEKNKTN
jgi:hypothetical protein